jgi:hypothetical protein
MNTATQDAAGFSPVLHLRRDFKSRMFIMVFHDKKRLLNLYNAMGGRDYTDPEQLIITTLENAIYMSMKNDLSFLIGMRLSLYEHQSTFNPNMAIRFLFYLADLYSALLKGCNLYSTKRVMIPPPKFIVFYNGIEERPDHEIIRLSDSYVIQGEPISLELLVEVFNINKGHNRELMEACKDLSDYAEYTYRVRKYAKEMPIEDAVERTINECIQEGILKDFLLQNRAEAKKVSIYEYNEEEHMRMERKDAYEDGVAAGREEGLTAGREEGLAAGRKEERSQLFELISKLSSDGLSELIPKLASDPDFYHEMMRKYFG